MKRIFSILFALALVMGLSLMMTAPVGAAPTWYVDPSGTDDGSHGSSAGAGAFKTIQYAINDSRVSNGDTIEVAAGTYSESITVNKSLTLLGVQANADPRLSAGGRSGPESIIAGTATTHDIYITADNVVVNGFTVRSTINSGSYNIIYAYYADYPQVLYNIVYNTNSSGSSNEGIKVRYSGDSGGVVSYNYVYDIPSPGDAINLDTVNGGFISYNEVRNIGSENAAIYVYNSLDTTIEGNLVDTTTQNDGIKLGNKGGGDAAKTGGSILHNTVVSTKQDGIAVYMSNVLVHGNDVSGSTSENGAIYIAFAVSNIDIQCNNVHGNTLSTGKWGNPAGVMIGTAVNAGTVKINLNNITNNSPNGVTNRATASVDATNNWWGHAGGPKHSSNPGGMGDTVSDGVTFSPWLGEALVPAKGTATSTGTGTASFSSDQGNIVGLTGVPTPPSPPVEFPHGMFDFTICCMPSGGTVTLNVTLPGNVPVGTKWYKYNGGAWDALPIGDDDGDSFITIMLTDGDPIEDEDSIPGQITDQGGPGGGGGAVGWETYPPSKVRVLLPWIVLLAAIAVGASLLLLRHRQTTT